MPDRFLFVLTAAAALLAASTIAEALGRVYLSGYFNRVGAVPMYAEKPLTLSQAILEAGGFRQFADDRRVKVTRTDRRGETQTFVVDVKSVLKDGKVDKDMLLQDGDR